MLERNHFTERRQHERACVQNLIIGILNSGEPITIGSITDISLGGLKYTYNELKMAPDDSPISSIDLIADSHCLFDIPCESVWNVKMETESQSKLIDLWQCGIQFGKLPPNQIFLLRSFINSCSPQGISNIPSKVHIIYS